MTHSQAAGSRKALLLLFAAVASLLACSLPSRTAHAFSSKGVCPGVTCTGGAPQFGNSNGRVQHPEIVLIFWQDAGRGGYQWTGSGGLPGTNVPSQREVVAATLSLVNSPYAAAATQYGIRGGGTISPQWTLSPLTGVYTGAPPNSFGSTANYGNVDIKNIVDFEIDNHLVPEPSANSADDMIYVVMVPSSVVSACGPGCNQTASTPDGRDYVWAYVSNPNYTATLSHELVESVVAAWQGAQITNCTTSSGTQLNGIGDVCQCNANFENQNSFNVQAYWSAVDGACVIPETWGPLIENDREGSGYHVPPGSAPVRQIYGGAGGVVETFANDLPYYYNGASTQWLFAGAGATYAAGGNGIAMLALDGSEIDYFNIAQHQWFNVGTPPGGATSITIVYNGWLVATDMAGNPWYSQNGGWVQFGGPGDQFIAIGYNIYALGVDHSYIAEFRGSQFGTGSQNWTIVGDNDPAQIVGSSDQTTWGVTMRGQAVFYPFDTTVTNERFFDGLQFAVSGAVSAPYVGMGRKNVFEQSTNRTTPWYDTNSGPVGRLVSGKEAYATACPSTALPCVNY
jgi:hypothetical protein